MLVGDIGIRAAQITGRGRWFMNEENGRSGWSAGGAGMSAESSVSAITTPMVVGTHCGN